MNSYGSFSEPLKDIPVARNVAYLNPETGTKLLCSCNPEDVPLGRNPENSDAETGTQLVCTYNSEAVPVRNLHYSKPESERPSPLSRRRIAIPVAVGLALWMVVLLFELSPIFILMSVSDSETTRFAPNSTIDSDDDDFSDALRSPSYLGVYRTRTCSLEECLSSPCRDAASAHFVCLSLTHNQQVRGGCGSTPWRPEVCRDQCNAIVCEHLLGFYEQEKRLAAAPLHSDCDVECPKHWCRQQRLCGDDSDPYQCTEGESKYGCSADKFKWTLRSTDDVCSSCCKATSCDDPIE